jgi:hypothetical protein
VVNPVMAGFLCGLALICETWALEVAVIPAKAGIHFANLRKCAVVALDSRFRGNDWRFDQSRRSSKSLEVLHEFVPESYDGP